MSESHGNLSPMTLLTEAQLAYLHSEVGSDYDESDLQVRYDQLGSVLGVAVQVVSLKLAELESDASSLTLPGIVSQSYDATIRALNARLARLQAAYQAELDAAELLTNPPEAGPSPGRLVRTDRTR